MRILLCSAIVGVFGLAACTSTSGSSGSGTTGTGSTGPIAIDDLPKAFSATACETAITCDGFFSFSSAAGCKAYYDAVILKGDGSLAELQAGVKAGKIKYDGAKARTCLKSQFTCDNFQGSSGKEPAACREAFVGSQADGTACTTNEFCASGRCDKGAGHCGKCAPLVASGGACSQHSDCTGDLVCVGGKCDVSGTIKLGDPCGPGKTCATGSFCPGIPDAKCTAVADKGGKCVSTKGCAAGLTCTAAQGSSEGACQEPGKLGDTCDFNSFETACAKGLVCVLTGDFAKPETVKSTCKTVRKLGEACESPLECKGLDTTCSAGKCATVGNKGSACTNSQPAIKSPCLPGLSCDGATSKCSDPPVAGQPCGDNGSCADGAHCGPGQKCVASQDVGGPCQDDGECLESKKLHCEQGGDPSKPGKCAADAECK
jgi:hypothetical protein